MSKIYKIGQHAYARAGWSNSSESYERLTKHDPHPTYYLHLYDEVTNEMQYIPCVKRCKLPECSHIHYKTANAEVNYYDIPGMPDTIKQLAYAAVRDGEFSIHTNRRKDGKTYFSATRSMTLNGQSVRLTFVDVDKSFADKYSDNVTDKASDCQNVTDKSKHSDSKKSHENFVHAAFRKAKEEVEKGTGKGMIYILKHKEGCENLLKKAVKNMDEVNYISLCDELGKKDSLLRKSCYEMCVIHTEKGCYSNINFSQDGNMAEDRHDTIDKLLDAEAIENGWFVCNKRVKK